MRIRDKNPTQGDLVNTPLPDRYKVPALVLVDHDVHPGFQRPDTALYNTEPSLTRQEFSEECDINTIMARYEQTGVVSHVNPREPMYVDFTVLPADLAGTLAQLKLGEDAFMSLPAVVRREFDNNAIDFVAFASDPANLEQMREWGLAPPAEPAAPAPSAPPVAAPAPPAPVAGGASTQ